MGHASELTDYLANEVRLRWSITASPYRYVGEPQDLEAFAIGFTLSERIVSHINDIKGVELEFTP